MKDAQKTVHPRTSPTTTLARTQDVERHRQSRLDHGIPKRLVHLVVVVLHSGETRQHHTAQAQRLDGGQIRDALLWRAHCALADAEEASRALGTELRDPSVVRLEAGPLV